MNICLHNYRSAFACCVFLLACLASAQELLSWQDADLCVNAGTSFEEVARLVGWDEVAWGPAERCEERCLNNRTSCDDIAYLFYARERSVSTFGTCDPGLLPERWTGSTLFCRLDNWMNCNCASCNSWQGMSPCRCFAPGRIPLIRNGFDCAEGTKIPALGSCTAQCEPGMRPLVDQIFCDRGTWTTLDGLEELDFQNPKLQCFAVGPPAKPEGIVNFVDDDPRSGKVSGVFGHGPGKFALVDFILRWGDAEQRPIQPGSMLANFSAAQDGTGFTEGDVLSSSIPSSAAFLLMYAANKHDGVESELPLHAPVLDVGVEPLEPEANQTFSLQVDVLSGSAGWQDGYNWTLAPDASECDMGLQLQDPLAREWVPEGAGGTQRLELRWPELQVETPGFHKLCGIRGSETLLAARLFVRWPTLTVEAMTSTRAASLVAGTLSTFLLLDSLALLSQTDRLAVVPVSVPCRDEAGNATVQQHHGILAEGSSNKSVQLWEVRPTTSGPMQVCWSDCWSRTWRRYDAECWQALLQVHVHECAGCEEPCQSCFLSTASSCTSLRNSTVDKDGSECDSIVNSTALPLVANTVWELQNLDVCACSLNTDCYDSTYLSLTVSSGGRLAAVADPDARLVHLFADGQIDATYELGRSTCLDEERCAYVAEDVPRGRLNSPEFLRDQFAPYDCGDGGPATEARFMRPVSVRYALSGSYLLIVDAEAHRVRRIDVDAHGAPLDIFTVAGSGQAAFVDTEVLPAYPRSRLDQDLELLNIVQGNFKGDGRLASMASLNFPWDVAINPEAQEEFIVADRMNFRIRHVNSQQIISTVAGAGDPRRPPIIGQDGDGALATNAWLFEPSGVEWVPQGGGSFIVAERYGHRIRLVDSAGIIWTVPGSEGLRAPVQPRISAAGAEIMLVQESFATASAAAQSGISAALEAPSRRVLMSLPLLITNPSCSAATGGEGCLVKGPPLSQEVNGSSNTTVTYLKHGHYEEFDGNVIAKHFEVATVASTGEGDIYMADMQGAILRMARRLATCPTKTQPIRPSEDSITLCNCAPGYEPLNGSAGSSGEIEASVNALVLTCKLCLPGYYCTGGFEPSRACQGGRTSTAGAASIADCVCAAGYFLYAGRCQPCPEGVTCPAAWDPELVPLRQYQVQAGYWVRRSASGYQVIECIQEKHCPWEEAASSTAAEATFTTDNGLACTNHREGFACGRCGDGFVESTKANCNPCDVALDWMPKVGAAFFCIYGLALFYTYMNKPDGSHFVATYILTGVAAALTEFLQQYALLAGIAVGFKVDFLETVLRILNSLDMSGDTLQCYFGSSITARYLVRLALPWQLALYMALLYLFLRITRRWRARYWPATLPKRLAFAQDVVAVVKTFELESSKVWNTIGFIACGIYTMMTKRVLEIFVFHRPITSALPTANGMPMEIVETTYLEEGPLPQVWTLVAHPDVITYQEGVTDEFTALLPLGLAALFFYSFSILALHILFTLQAPLKFTTSESFRIRHKYFFAKYREDCYWWGVVAMARSLILMIVFALGSFLPGSAVWVAFLVQLVYMHLFLRVGPCKVSISNQLELCFSALLVIMIAVQLPQAFAYFRLIEAFASEETSPRFVLATSVAVSCAVGLLACAGVLWTVILAHRWEHNKDDLQLKVDCLCRSLFTSQVGRLHLDTLRAASRAMSEPERCHLLDGLAFLEPALLGVKYEAATAEYPPAVSIALEGMQKATRSVRSLAMSSSTSQRGRWDSRSSVGSRDSLPRRHKRKGISTATTASTAGTRSRSQGASEDVVHLKSKWETTPRNSGESAQSLAASGALSPRSPRDPSHGPALLGRNYNPAHVPEGEFDAPKTPTKAVKVTRGRERSNAKDRRVVNWAVDSEMSPKDAQLSSGESPSEDEGPMDYSF